MDPIIIGLATKVVGILSPYVAKSGEEFVKAVGQAAYDKSKSLLETLKKRFSGDAFATGNLEHFEKDPETYKKPLENILEEKMAQNKDFADELQKHLKDMGPQVDVIMKMKVGEKIVGLEADEMTGGRAKVDMDIEQAKDVTGARIKRIG
jgi:hypothetical protein